MLITDYMSTNFVSCTMEETLEDVTAKFLNTPSKILPVVNEENVLIGIVTQNKIFRLLASKISFKTNIRDFYIANPIFLSEMDSREEARIYLLKHNVGHAPVINKERNPIGLLSTQELLDSYNIVHNQLTSLIDFAYDAMILVNKNAEITMVNNSFSDLFQLSSKEVLFKSTSDLFPELEIENIMKHGTSISNIPQIIGGQQCLISIKLVRENGVVNSAICKISFRGLKNLQEALTKVKRLEEQVSAYKDEIHNSKGTKYTLHDIAGESKVIRKVKDDAMLASKSLSTVLITGETGTGKELFAQGIHAASNQAGRFVEINCAAIPSELLESELFGYAGGAFTGAKPGGMKGKFELAQNGTIFLDEIGDMPLPLQAKLLRVLQEKEFRPIGSPKTIHLNTKIIAATHQNIRKLIQDGKFREDLFYRLNIMTLTIPPLRQRMEDVPDIINHIIEQLNQDGFYIRGVTHSALTKLMSHSWPGNVRELHNVLERAANLKTGDYIDVDDLSSIPDNSEGISTENTYNYQERINMTEKETIVSALKEAQGNKTRASKLLGISRPWLYKKMKEYGVN
ncbi:transcriptional regulator with PAS, ATPase and Fis domain [Neobacillus niacini]|uniref:sigma 54-interacting transcriptional regulator n=1 Tax=Neobacillus niacini TaxID=86668 RepID=UPI002781849B|nr:sigma 54-interacting transcriptional regulator [Neobacillus niacini]MDQ1005315.1 transcriptional regulator with PAS, ATPase and Fis domain [Neobacillus niacini]